MALPDPAAAARKGGQLDIFAAAQVPGGVESALLGAPGEPATDAEMRPIPPEMQPDPGAPPTVGVEPAQEEVQVAGGIGAVLRAVVGGGRGGTLTRAAGAVAEEEAKYVIRRIPESDARFEEGVVQWELIHAEAGAQGAVSVHPTELAASQARGRLLSPGPVLDAYRVRRIDASDPNFAKVHRLRKTDIRYLADQFTPENPWAVLNADGSVLSLHASKEMATASLQPYAVVAADGTVLSYHATKEAGDAALQSVLSPGAVHVDEAAARAAFKAKHGEQIGPPPPGGWAILSPEAQALALREQSHVTIRPTNVQGDEALRSLLDPRPPGPGGLASTGLRDFRAVGARGDEKIPDEGRVLDVIETLSDTFHPEITSAHRGVISTHVTQQLADYMGMRPAELMAALERMPGTGGVPIVKGHGLSETLLAVRNLLFTEVSKLDRLASLATNKALVGGKMVNGLFVDEAGNFVAPGHGAPMPGGSAMDLVNFRQQFEVVANLQAMVKGAQTEVARSLNTFKTPVGQTSAEFSNNLDDILAQFGGANDVAKMADAYFNLPHGSARLQFTKISTMRKFSNAAFEVWINLLLSGPVTHTKNFVSAGYTVFAEIPVDAGAALWNTARRAGGGDPGGVTFGEVHAKAFGQLMSLREAWSAVGRNLQYGETPIAGSKIELGRAGQDQRPNAFSGEAFGQFGFWGRSIDMLGTALTLGRVPTKMLGAEDTFWKMVAQRGSLWQQAYRSAQELGLKGDAASDHITQFMIRPPGEAVERANTEAVRLTLQTPLAGEVGGGISKVARIPGMRWFLPFVKTPYNAVTFAFEHTPLAIFTRQWKQAMESGDPSQIQRAQSRRALGSGAVAIIGYQTISGEWTGSGPVNPALRARLMDQGWRPYSRRVTYADGTIEYISYAGAEPYSTIIGLVVDSVEMGQRMGVGPLTGDDHPMAGQLNAPAEGWEQFAFAVSLALSENLTHKTFMAGFANLMNVLTDGERYAGGAAGSFVQSWVPAVLRQPARVGIGGDEYAHRGQIYEALPERFEFFTDEHRERYAAVLERYPEWQWIAQQLDGFKSQIPGFSDTLPVDRNFWGDPVLRQSALGPDLMSPYKRSKFVENPLDMEMIRLGIRERDHSRYTAGFPLTDEERSRFEQLVGERLKVDLADLYEIQTHERELQMAMGPRGLSPNEIPVQDMKAEWQSVIARARQAGMVDLREEFPRLDQVFREFRAMETDVQIRAVDLMRGR